MRAGDVGPRVVQKGLSRSGGVAKMGRRRMRAVPGADATADKPRAPHLGAEGAGAVGRGTHHVEELEA